MTRAQDEQAIARYRYLLRTAPPDAIEAAHAEAFAQLTPDQRAEVLRRLAEALPVQERPQQADPRTLARAATRAEMRRPGTLERSFGGAGFGSLLAGSLLGTIAGSVIGTAIASQLLGGADEAAANDAAEADQDAGDEADLEGGDVGDSGDFGGGDFGDA